MYERLALSRRFARRRAERETRAYPEGVRVEEPARICLSLGGYSATEFGVACDNAMGKDGAVCMGLGSSPLEMCAIQRVAFAVHWRRVFWCHQPVPAHESLLSPEGRRNDKTLRKVWAMTKVTGRRDQKAPVVGRTRHDLPYVLADQRAYGDPTRLAHVDARFAFAVKNDQIYRITLPGRVAATDRSLSSSSGDHSSVASSRSCNLLFVWMHP